MAHKFRDGRNNLRKTLSVKLHLFAPATVTAVLLTLTSYSVTIDNAVRDLLGAPHVQPAAQPQDAAQPDSDAGPVAGQPMAVADPAQTADQAAAASEVEADESAQQTPAASPVMQKSARVEKGDTLSDVLARAGVSRDEIPDVQAALGKVLNLHDLKPGEEFDTVLQKDDDGVHLVGLNTQPDAERTISLTALNDGGFSAHEIKAHLTNVTRAAIGTVDGSLYDAAAKEKLPQSVLAAFIRAYSYSVDFQRDIQPGDKFAVLYEATVNDHGDVVRTGNILAAFLRVGDKPQRIYLYRTAEGSVEFFAPDGHSIRRTLLRTPIDGARITSGFGMRMHPLLGYTKMHKGVDFGAPPGTPVFAAGDGVVEKMGWWGGYGKYVRLRHNADTGTAYAHLSRFNPNLREGSHVRQGQIIAFTGSTGASTGPHLHFEVLKNGVQVNPLTVTATLGNVLQGRDLEAFRKMMAERDQQIRELIQPPEVATRNVTTASKIE
jgi:murein DD-endopeptidase MepM/ murein hydrolase activator NlpD